MLSGNVPYLDDDFNTDGYHTNGPKVLNDDEFFFRLDHNFTDKVKFFGRYMYHRNLAPSALGQNTGQVDFVGGTASSASSSDLRGDGFITGLDWTVRSNLINSLHVGWIRSRQDFNVL